MERRIAPSARIEEAVDRILLDGVGGAERLVVLHRIRGGGHTWPGGVNDPTFGASTAATSATELMWSFFAGAPPRTAPSPSPSPTG